VNALPQPGAGGLRVQALSVADEARLQRFFDANPDYFVHVTGAPPRPNEAHEALHDAPPPQFGYTRQWSLGYADAHGVLQAFAQVVADLFAPAVWHLGLFIVATARHGRGDAQQLLAGIEAWAQANGAQWMRLGVVAGHARAERFWQRQGYRELRQRHGMTMGERVNTVRVLVKPLAGGAREDYLALVPRDRPEAPQ
jgi:GNAT superfamily N-acetyltransferase